MIGFFVPHSVQLCIILAHTDTYRHTLTLQDTHRHTNEGETGVNDTIHRICQHCGNDFIAQTTTTKYCSHTCNQRAYKAQKRKERINAVNEATRKAIIRPVEELKSKPYLSVAETCTLMGISRRTVYRMIRQGLLSVAKAGSRTILRRTDIDQLFDLQQPEKKKKQQQPVKEFYTVQEIEQLYHIKYGRLNAIVKEKDIPKTVHNGRLLVSKPHIDRYFKHNRQDTSAIAEWYTVQQIQEKYGLTRDQIYSRTHDHNIPRQRVGKYVKISQQHFDELFEIGV